MNSLKSYPSGKISATTIRRNYQIPRTNAFKLWNIQEPQLNDGDRARVPAIAEDFSKLRTIDEPREEDSVHRRARGVDGITSAGGQTVKDAVFLLEKDYGRDKLTFFTGTLPPGCCLLVRWSRDRWAHFWELFRKRISYSLAKRGLPSHIVGVTEMQEKRNSRTGELAYHAHCVWVGRLEGMTWAMLPTEYQQHWNECIKECCDDDYDESDVDWNATCNVQRVKKTVVGYLGKYLSKGRAAVRRLGSDFDSSKLPASWYICTRKLLHSVRSHTKHFYGEAASFVYDFLRGNADEYLSYQREILWETPDGWLVPVGWYGYLKIPLEKIF